MPGLCGSELSTDWIFSFISIEVRRGPIYDARYTTITHQQYSTLEDNCPFPRHHLCHAERVSRSPERSEGEASAGQRPFTALRVTTHGFVRKGTRVAVFNVKLMLPEIARAIHL